MKTFRFKFKHQSIYPRWVSHFLTTEHYRKVCSSGKRLFVGLTRPAKYLGFRGSVGAGSVAYIVDKFLLHSIHPKLPKVFGLKQEFVELTKLTSIDEARSLLCASSSAPPILSARMINGSLAFDGGYTDNAPIPDQTYADKIKTLVLLTRNYRTLPQIFRHKDRTYLQPSTRVPVSTWDCTERATVTAAIELGLADAKNLLDRHRIVIAKR